MDSVSLKNTLSRAWAYSPTLDPNGDQIIEASESGYVYNHIGPNKKLTLEPLFSTAVDTFKTTILLLVIALAVLNVYETFGCKSQYLQNTRPFQSQLILFLAIFITIVSVQNSKEEENNIYNSTPVLFIYAFLSLLIINIVVRTGNGWAVFDYLFGLDHFHGGEL